MRGLFLSLETPMQTSMSMLSDYLELTKPGVVWLIILSTAIGFYMGVSGSLPLVLLMHTLAATALLAGGTGALNQWMERDLDACMRRTEKRPLPAGRLQPFSAFLFGVGLVLAGLLYLALVVNALTALLGLLTTTGYLFIYTPLKTRTPLSTFLGSFPGAMPPLIGWVAAQNKLEPGGWALFLVLFFWQFPHFYAIAWMYREDYAKAGVLMLPVVKPDGVAVGHRIILYAALLLPVSLIPVLLGMTGTIYLIGAGVCGLGYFLFGLFAAHRKTTYHARRLLQASVVYLPLIYFLLVFDKVP